MGGRFDEKYTPRQREALIAATLDRKPALTVPEAVKRAKRGELMDDLEPFDVKESTVYDLRRTERIKRRGPVETTPLSQYATEARALLAEQFEAEKRKGKAADPHRLAYLLKALKLAISFQEEDKPKPEREPKAKDKTLTSRLKGAALNGANPVSAHEEAEAARTRGPQLEPAA